jgi:DNA-binding transcriptional LysR family regulator
MSLNRLKTLVAIAESGSFVEAAQRVFLTPAAVGQQIKLLEKELGVQLFDRNMRSPRLNPLGRALVPRAREIIKSYENLVPSLLGEPMELQEISIGAVPTTMSGLVPRALAALRSNYHNLHIRIVPGLSAELLPLVEQGYLDAAIISKPPQSYAHMHFRAFAEEPYVLLAATDAAAVEPELLLESQPFIRFNRRAWVGQQVDEWLRRKKIKVVESMELDTLEMISSMVFHGLGVSIVPRPCVPSPRPLPVLQIPLDASASPRTLGVISHPDSTKFKLIDILLGELIRIVGLCEEVDSQRFHSN